MYARSSRYASLIVVASTGDGRRWVETTKDATGAQWDAAVLRQAFLPADRGFIKPPGRQACQLHGAAPEAPGCTRLPRRATLDTAPAESVARAVSIELEEVFDDWCIVVR